MYSIRNNIYSVEINSVFSFQGLKSDALQQFGAFDGNSAIYNKENARQNINIVHFIYDDAVLLKDSFQFVCLEWLVHIL